jgi:hypothetical protein
VRFRLQAALKLVLLVEEVEIVEMVGWSRRVL